MFYVANQWKIFIEIIYSQDHSRRNFGNVLLCSICIVNYFHQKHFPVKSFVSDR